MIWGKGNSVLTGRLLSPILIEARTARLTVIVQMPWYPRALELSRPLHFGDYGGLPRKVAWALLDVLTMVVLLGGLGLWSTRRKK